MLKIKKLVCLITLLFSAQSHAGIIDEILGPIKGIADSLMRQYGLSLDALSEAKSQLMTTKSELNELSHLKKANQGSYGWGNLKNTLSDLKGRQWSADNWQDTVSNIAGDNSATYKTLLKSYQKAHPILDSKLFSIKDNNLFNQYKSKKLLAQNADAQATSSYNRINQHFNNIHKLSSEIEKATNSKSAIDLNARLTAENANVQTEVLKQLTILNKQSASDTENKLYVEEKKAQFNQLPDE
jgi:type IV secretion system protein VirB5